MIPSKQTVKRLRNKALESLVHSNDKLFQDTMERLSTQIKSIESPGNSHGVKGLAPYTINYSTGEFRSRISSKVLERVQQEFEKAGYSCDSTVSEFTSSPRARKPYKNRSHSIIIKLWD